MTDADCPNCGGDNLTDYPVCPSCAAVCHFTHRTDCQHCRLTAKPSGANISVATTKPER